MIPYPDEKIRDKLYAVPGDTNAANSKKPFPTHIDLAIGSRVRCTRNISNLLNKYSIDEQHDVREYLSDLINEIKTNEKEMFNSENIYKLFATVTITTRYCKSCNYDQNPKLEEYLINSLAIDIETTNITSAINKFLTSNNQAITHFKCLNTDCEIPTETNEVRIFNCNNYII